MKVIITMAGEGSRFRDAGVNKPKHRISIDGESMFWFSMRSLTSFFDEEFVFVCLEAHDDPPFIKSECARLGIEHYDIVEIPEMTDGQAATVIKAKEHVASDQAILIYNIDTYIEENVIKKEAVKGDGWIPVFRTKGDRWSFTELDGEKVCRVAEKERISDLATAGLYYFDQLSDYTAAFAERGESIKSEYGEKYIAPLYSWLIENGKFVYPEIIPEDRVHVLGTPEDLVSFYPQFETRVENA
jgi:dTDP-glucose pyrophosphorylase